MIKHLLAAILIFTLLGVKENAYADHCVGADISFQYVGVDSYQVTFSFYRDCQGISYPTDAFIDASSASTGQYAYADLPLVGTPQDITPICLSLISQDKCNAGTSAKYPGIQQAIYTGLLVLPVQASDWVISWSSCCRNFALTNIQNPGSTGLYIQATLNNIAAPIDNSPLFTGLPVPFFCDMVPANYNMGAYDPDNDSLVYSTVTPMATGVGPGNAVTYTPGFSSSYPLTTSPANTFNFSTSTGQISFTPSGQQVTDVAVIVSEYRKGVLIGSVMRDVQMWIETCTSSPPNIFGVSTITGGVSANNSFVITTCPNANLSFQMIGTDSNSALDLFYSTDIGSVLPAVTYYTNGDNPDTTYYNWTPTINDTGLHYFTVTLQNDACPIYGTQIYTFTVDVVPGVKAGPTLSVCNGTPVQLTATGGGTYLWTPTTGLSNDSISDPVATPSVTTTYVVTTNLPSGCMNIDSEVVNVGVIGLTNGINQSICKGQSIQLTAGAGNIFTWTPSSGLSCSTCEDPIANPTASTTYTVTVSDTSGCTSTANDTIIVVLPPNVPRITIKGDTLVSTANTDNQWYFNGTVITGATDSTYVASDSGYYTVVVTNPANGCSSSSDSVYFTTAGIQQVIALSRDVQIFPNPFNNNVNLIISPEEKDVKDWIMKVTDELGRTVYDRSSLDYNNVIDLSALPCGVYFISIITKTTRAEFPIIRQN